MRSVSELYVHRSWPQLRCEGADELLARKDYFARGGGHYPAIVAMFKQLLEDGIDQLRLLSVGCGAGIDLLEFAGWGIQTIGLDTVVAYAKMLNSLGRWFSLPLAAISGDACKLPFVSGYFDVVVSESVFEHLYDVDAAISEQIRVLRHGGKMIVLDGNMLNPKLLFDLLVLYPIRTRGRRGGIDWLLNRNKLRKLGKGMWFGRDEDIHTPRWWRRKLEEYDELEVLQSATTGHFTHPSLPAWLLPFVGMCLVVARRV